MIRVAHVGAHESLTDDDKNRIEESMFHVGMLDADFLGKRKTWDVDVVNLIYGRDFLSETKEYDLVVVHSIFDSRHAVLSKITLFSEVLNTSPLHSIENWCKRLAETKATFIVVCEGQPCTLNGWHLDKIDGYDISIRDHRIAVYRKSNSNKNAEANKIFRYSQDDKE